MEKYNKLMDVYMSGQKAAEEKVKVLDEEMEKRHHEIFDQFVSGVEDAVKDWTKEDMDKFVRVAKDDERLSCKDVMLVVASYGKTHPDDERHSKRVSNIGAIVMLSVLSDLLD